MRSVWLTLLYWVEDVFTRHYWAVALAAIAMIALLAWSGVVGIPGGGEGDGCVQYGPRVQDC